MTTAAELPPEQQPQPIGSVVQELYEVPTHTTRMLGRLAVDESETGLFGAVVKRGDSFTTDQSKEFTQLLHTLVSSKVQQINSERGAPPTARIISTRRVHTAIEDLYNVFSIWENRVSETELEKKRVAYIKEQIGHAYNVADKHPEIKFISGLEKDLRHNEAPEAAESALLLLAAYGWATRDDFAASRMELMRATQNTHRL